MTPRSCAATVSLLGAIWGCSASKEATGEVTGISPDAAYNDVPFTVRIDGKMFRPAYSFDTMAAATTAEARDFSVRFQSIAGDGAVALQAVTWKDPTELRATVPPHVEAGLYDLIVTDPRGQTVPLHQAFTSLGPDLDPPVLALHSPSPRSTVGALTTIKIEVSADDGHGFVQSMDVTAWTAATAATPTRVECLDPSMHKGCEATPAHTTCCKLEFPVPTPADENDAVEIVAHAVDTLGNEAPELTARFPVAPRPVVTDMSPVEGPIAGGTDLVVRGRNFVAGNADFEGTRLLIDGRSISADITSTEIHVKTPAHDAGFAKVQVVTGLAFSPERSFEFVAPPRVRQVFPAGGPLAGGTWLKVAGNAFRRAGAASRGTTIFVGGRPLDQLTFVDVTLMEGRVPEGTGPGSVAVTAYDEVGGEGVAAGMFIYDPADPQTDPPEGGYEAPPFTGAR